VTLQGVQRTELDLDLFADAALFDPYSHYRQLRDLGATVWLRPLGMFALARYADVRDALRNWEAFSSARGVAMNEVTNQGISGNTLGSDPPLHDQLRRVLVRPLSPPAMRAITGMIETEAEALAERLVARKTFDAATDLAQHLPVTVISHLVGLPEAGRERMLDWGTAAFNSLGPENERCKLSTPIAFGLIDYALKLDPATVKPGSWAAMAFEAADRGEITLAQARGLLLDYTGPSLDTTILAISSGIWLFARHPEQWDLIREQPALIPSAINEILRIESPIQVFSRYVTRDHDIDGVILPQGSRALLLYGSANRDERKWEEPERFDVRRKAAEQLAFGHGEHMCVGLPLARLEIRALLTALARRVRRFEILDSRRLLNNTLRGLEQLTVSVER
jgi:cytochrome P450